LREKRHKGVEKGDKAFLESLYYTKERVTMQLPMEERKVGDAGKERKITIVVGITPHGYTLNSLALLSALWLSASRQLVDISC
jgi:hypothetical protein